MNAVRGQYQNQMKLTAYLLTDSNQTENTVDLSEENGEISLRT